MRFKIQADNLVGKLGLVQGIAKKNAVMPVLSHILIIAKEDKIEICATDVENTMVTWSQADVLQQGSIVLPANELFNIVRELVRGRSTHEGSIEIEEVDNNWVKVKARTTLFKIAGLPSEDFPTLPEIEAEPSLHVKSSVMQSMIAKTIFAVSSDALRRNICGILFNWSATSIQCVATDGLRLSMATHVKDEADEFDKECTIPTKGVTELKKLLKLSEHIRIGLADNFFIAECYGELRVISKVIDADFPDYKKIITTSSKVHIDIVRNEFIDALQRVSLLASGQAKGIKFTLDEDGLTLVAVSPELGQATELMLVDYSGETIEFGCNSRFLLDVLKAITHDKVRLGLTDDNSPIVIKPEVISEDATKNSDIVQSVFGKEPEIFVVMPMRL